MPISLQQFQAICQDRYTNVKVVTTRPGEPFPEKNSYLDNLLYPQRTPAL